MKLLVRKDVFDELSEQFLEKSISHRKEKIRKLVRVHPNKGKDYFAYRLCNANPDMAKWMGKVDKKTREKYIKENEDVLTHQAFIEMSPKDKKDFIEKVKQCHYYLKDGVYVAYGRKEKAQNKPKEKKKFKREFFAAKQLAKLGNPTYLIPEHIAKYPDTDIKNKGNDKDLADMIYNDTLTDAKQTESRGGIQDSYSEGRHQGDNVFIEVTNKKINKDSAIRAIIGRIKVIKESENYNGKSFEGKIYLYLHNDKKMYCFNSDKNGWITDEKN